MNKIIKALKKEIEQNGIEKEILRSIKHRQAHKELKQSITLYTDQNLNIKMGNEFPSDIPFLKININDFDKELNNFINLYDILSNKENYSNLDAIAEIGEFDGENFNFKVELTETLEIKLYKDIIDKYDHFIAHKNSYIAFERYISALNLLFHITDVDVRVIAQRYIDIIGKTWNFGLMKSSNNLICNDSEYSNIEYDDKKELDKAIFKKLKDDFEFVHPSKYFKVATE